MKETIAGILMIITFMSIILMPPPATAASKADIDKMTTYAVILGRASACGINADYASKRVGSWLDRKFPPGSQDQKTYLPIFIQGMKYHADQQAKGNSPDTCSQVRSSFRKMQWP